MSDNKTDASSVQIFETLFTKSNIILLVWFLAIYLIMYVLLNMFFNKGKGVENYAARMSKILDIMVFIFLFCFILIKYENMSTSEKENAFASMLKQCRDYIEDSYSLFGLILFIAALYLTIYMLGIPMNPENKPFTITIVENVSYIFLAIILINDFFKYVLGIDLIDYLLSDSNINWFKHAKETDVSGNNVKDTSGNKVTDTSGNKVKDTSDNKVKDASGNKKPDEVFNIRNNIYTFEEAPAVCSIYNAKLATYEQIEDSYNAGGEWCNYGWSDGQIALFPTQKNTWDKLQKSDKTKHACGRPGINGGYMSNPNIRFGVNCFGQKPEPTQMDKDLMLANGDIKIPESEADKELNVKLKIWKDHPEKFLLLNSFNRKEWTEY